MVWLEQSKVIFERLKAIRIFRKIGIWFVLMALILVFSFISPNFAKFSNLMTIARQAAMTGIASAGFIMVMLVGGIDLSIGSMVTFTNIIVAHLIINKGMSPVIAGAIGIALCTLTGLFNSIMIADVGIPALIATLASQIALNGTAYLLSNGMPIYGFEKNFSVLGQGYIFKVIPIPVVIMIVCFAISSFILNKTIIGRRFYAVGSSANAAELSGISVKKTFYLAYSVSGFFAGLSGLVLLSRTNSGQPGAGSGFEFDVITALVLGGVSVAGGAGSISNAVVGALIIGVLSNGFIIAGVNTYVQMIIKGAILLVAVGFDCVQKKRQMTVKKKR